VNELNTWKIDTPQRIGNKLLVQQKKFSIEDLEKKKIDKKTDELKEQLRKEEEEKIQKEQDTLKDNYSSGIESDNDLDLLVEQEVLKAIRMRKQFKK